MNEKLSFPDIESIIPLNQEISVLDAVAILGEALNKSDQEIYDIFTGLKAAVNVSVGVNGIVAKFSMPNIQNAHGGEPVEVSIRFEILNSNISDKYERMYDKTFERTGALQSATYMQLENGEHQVVVRHW